MKITATSREAFEGWPAGCVELVRRSCEAHGGLERFREVQTISLTVKKLDGPLPWIKGVRALPERVEVFPFLRKTIFHGYPQSNQFGIWDRGSVALYSAESFDVPLVQSARHRATFRGWSKNRRWTAMDTLYFFGYALHNYCALPFLLPELEFVDSWSWKNDGRTYFGISVKFPDEFDSHGNRQRFLFDEDGLILRHDYCAEVVGNWATGAHFWRDYEVVDGFAFPRQRNVVATVGGLLTPLPVLNGVVADFSVRFRSA